ncbi:DUF397 domain-containing protein [Actinophytocola sp. NPDC049390]|uniref:DUF397 domain-containing protein n=1 Tax=Actinophytocola sp. NPDC049390 TaxID=3363894 RepID=UPI0037BA1278
MRDSPGSCLPAWQTTTTFQERPQMEWRKSSYSGADNGGCVEVAFTARVVDVRDSKDTDGPVLRFSPAQWRAFTARRAPRP